MQCSCCCPHPSFVPVTGECRSSPKAWQRWCVTRGFPHVASGLSNASSRRNAVFKRHGMVLQLRHFFLRRVLFLGTATLLQRWLYVGTRLPAPH